MPQEFPFSDYSPHCWIQNLQVSDHRSSQGLLQEQAMQTLPYSTSDGCRCNAECSRPHNSNRKSTDCTGHHQHNDPEYLHGAESFNRKSFLSFFMQGIDRGSQKYDSIKYRNDRPDACKDFPVFYSKSAEENRRDQYHSHMSPALNGLVLNLKCNCKLFYFFSLTLSFLLLKL